MAVGIAMTCPMKVKRKQDQECSGLSGVCWELTGRWKNCGVKSNAGRGGAGQQGKSDGWKALRDRDWDTQRLAAHTLTDDRRILNDFGERETNEDRKIGLQKGEVQAQGHIGQWVCKKFIKTTAWFWFYWLWTIQMCLRKSVKTCRNGFMIANGKSDFIISPSNQGDWAKSHRGSIQCIDGIWSSAYASVPMKWSEDFSWQKATKLP